MNTALVTELPNKKFKYRRSTWFDPKKRAAVFGIQLNVGNGDGWKNLSVNGVKMLFGEEHDRDFHLKELRAGRMV